VINPFHSIVGKQDPPDYPPEQDGKSADRDSFVEALAADIRPDEIAEIAASIKEKPFGNSGLSSHVETGLCAAHAAKKVTSVRALPPQQRKPLRGGVYSPNEVLELLNIT
jgi:hypothetical protein